MTSTEARELYRYARTQRQRDVMAALIHCEGNATQAAGGLKITREAVRGVVVRCREIRDFGPARQREPAPAAPNDTIPAPAPSAERVPVDKTSPGIVALRKIVHGRARGAEPLEFEELCDRLDMSPRAARALVETAREQGLDVTLEDGRVGRDAPSDPTRETVVTMPAPTVGKFAIGGVGDIHFGSKQHMRAEFEDYCAWAYRDKGVRTMLHVGDIVDGIYKFSYQEQNVRGFEDQCDYAIAHLPGDAAPDATIRHPGMRWSIILGNHDETFDVNGLNVERAMVERFRAAGRTDVDFVGVRGGYVRLLAPGQKRGTIVELWHPKGGGAYALSYKLQNHIRDYAVGAKPDIVLQGHTHQSIYFEQRGVHAYVCGCWQGRKSAFGRSIGGAPSIGSWVIEYEVTEHETLRTVTNSWRAYYEGESPRTIEMG